MVVLIRTEWGSPEVRILALHRPFSESSAEMLSFRRFVRLKRV